MFTRYFFKHLVYYLPRCMGGCLLMHIGVDLTKEALYDSYSSFDVFEYVSGTYVRTVSSFSCVHIYISTVAWQFFANRHHHHHHISHHYHDNYHHHLHHGITHIVLLYYCITYTHIHACIHVRTYVQCWV